MMNKLKNTKPIQKKKRNRWLKYSAIAFLFILLTVIALGSNYLVEFAIARTSTSTDSISGSLNVTQDPAARTKEAEAHALEKQLQKEADEWAREHLSEEWSIYSKDNLLLVADFFGQKENTHRYGIILHGYHSAKEKIRSYAQKYFEQGYHVLTPDHRTHGESEGEYIGMGVLEKEDLQLWIKKIIDRDPEAEIVLHGISMGASTIMLASGDGFAENVKICVEDSGYSGVWQEFSDKLKSIYNLPEFPMLYGANLVSKIKAKYYFSDGNCLKALKKNTVPILFIHGMADDYNPFYMLEQVYEANGSDKKQKIEIPYARHAMSAFMEPDRYWESVWSFIEQYDMD